MTKDLLELMANRTDMYVREIHRARQTLRILDHETLPTAFSMLMNVPSWNKEVGHVSLYFLPAESGENVVEVDVTLQEDLEDPQLPRDLIRAGLANKLDKRQNYDGQSLTVSGDLFPNTELGFGKMRIEITGYVPKTCRIEYEEVVVPARTERRAKIICDPEVGQEG